MTNNFGFGTPAGDIHQPNVVDDVRPALVKAMRDSEPGTDNFETAAYLHDKLEEYLAEREKDRGPQAQSPG